MPMKIVDTSEHIKTPMRGLAPLHAESVNFIKYPHFYKSIPHSFARYPRIVPPDFVDVNNFAWTPIDTGKIKALSFLGLYGRIWMSVDCCGL